MIAMSNENLEEHVHLDESESHPEPRLRDIAGNFLEPATYTIIGADPTLPADLLAHTSAQYLPVLPDLLSLWLPGNLQIRRNKRQLNGSLAYLTLQPIQPWWI